MKRYISIALCGLLCFTAAAGCGAEPGSGGGDSAGGGASPGDGAETTTTDVKPSAPPNQAPDPTPTPTPSPPTGSISDYGEAVPATITMEKGGVIVLELYPYLAPQSVYNFVSLARQGFYDGLVFHRIMEGFMIQGGCPLGQGYGGPGYSILGEFEENGFTNDLSHTRGVLSMARSQDYDSAGSQFFIMHADSLFLDGAYAAFGKVVSGMDVVDEIAMTPNDGPNGSVADDKKPVIASITIDSDIDLPEPNKLR